MATSYAALPPIDKMAMIWIWMGTVLYGVNCVMYCQCMSILLRGYKTTPVHWALVTMATILFLLGTTYVGASLRQLLEAFVYAPADVPHYSIMYWLNLKLTPRAIHVYLYSTLVLVQDIVLTWRLYVVFMHDWRVIILPIMLTAGCIGCAYAASAVSTGPRTEPLLTFLVISTWACEFILNTSVTGAIVWRLWRLSRKAVSLMGIPKNHYASSIYMVIESGTISAVTNGVMLALFVSNQPAALFAFEIASQLTVLTPLLIVVQVAQTDRYRAWKGYSPQSETTTGP